MFFLLTKFSRNLYLKRSIFSVKQKETALKRIKLEYDNLNDKTNLNVQLTEILTASNIDMELLSKAIRCGISKTDRGDLWTYLSHRYESGNESFRHADSKVCQPYDYGRD